jgi:hypothetical protein
VFNIFKKMSWETERRKLKDSLIQLSSGLISFEELSLLVFQFQAKYNHVYAKYLEYLNLKPHLVSKLNEIPGLPIQAFKQYEVKTGTWDAAIVFKSSGTSGQKRSEHHVLDIEHYHDLSFSIFEDFFGGLKSYVVFALLPSYLEKGDASLVDMVRSFMGRSKLQGNGFFLYDVDRLLKLIADNEIRKQKSVLFGVSYALLDLVEKGPFDFKHLTIIETGGMKGRGTEIPKSIVIQKLQDCFPNSSIYSEYGMTELMSQAYRKEGVLYSSGFSMRIIPRQIADPLSIESYHKNAVLQIVDLGNIDSCAFILTEDVGKVREDHTFTIEGRLDEADLRGCHLMLADI